MGATNPTLRSNAWRILVIGVLLLLLLEVASRLAAPATGWIHPRYLEMSAGFPELEAVVEDVLAAFSGVRFYDEFLYATAPVSTAHVTFTDYFSARRTPDSAPLAAADEIVWAFGGSTMENHETTDELTIANTWARSFTRARGPTHVKNFGTGGFFSSYELIKFQKLLRTVPPAELPGMAIFYNGYNDALFGFQYGPGRMQEDLALKLRALVERRHLALLVQSSSQLVARVSRLWQRSGARWIESRLFPLPEPRADGDSLAGAVRVYVSNVRITQAVCEAFGVRCYFVLQPLLVTKSPLTPLEQEALEALEAHPRMGEQGARFVRDFYRAVADELAAEPAFLDASGILDGRDVSDFYDLGHVGVRTPPVIGEQTAAMILGALGFSAEPPTAEEAARAP